MSKVKVAVLGATGMIGQRFIEMLEDHPYFEMEGLYASERSEGKRLGDVLKVRDHVYKDETLDRRIEAMDLDKISKNCRIAFSGIPSDLAGPTETELEVNPQHIESIKDQSTYDNGGFIITNANCSSTGIAAPLAALNDAYGLKQVFISTYQALSGAGYPGVPSLDAVGNVVPFIKGEEEKMEAELAKMLGKYENKQFKFADFKVYANCVRVPVVDGHLESLTLSMYSEPSIDELTRTLENFKGEPQKLGLPSAPEHPIIVRKEENRPQPAFDVFAGGTGRTKCMAVTLGRIRKKDEFYKIFALSHNTLRGGAGGSVLNAELAYVKKLI